MAQGISALALFCQDARDEVGGTVSLIGILPDNVSYEGPGGEGTPMLPKLVVYSRATLDLAYDHSSIEFFIRTPLGEEIANNVVSPETITQAMREAAAEGNPIAGIVGRMEAAPFPLQAGRYFAVMRIADEEHLIGSLNCRITRTPSIS